MNDCDDLFTARDLILEMRNDVKQLLACQSATEERLKNGATHFKKTDDAIESHSDRIIKVEARKCPSFPSGKLTYTMITIGFIILGILIKTN